MKNKRLIALISIFAFLILIVILCSTLFTVKNVSVKWLTVLPQGHELIGQDKNIAGSIKQGGSVFLYDKDEAISTLEEKYPYLNVVKIETKFPNKLVIQVTNRQEFFAVKITDNCYVALDGYGKVLKNYTGLEYNALEKGVKPICVEVKEMALNADDFTVGKVANISKVSNILSVLYNQILGKNYAEYAAISVFPNITIDLGYNSSITIDTTWENVSVQITKISSKLSNKISFGLTAYEQAKKDNVVNSTIVVRELNNGSFDGELVAK